MPSSHAQSLFFFASYLLAAAAATAASPPAPAARLAGALALFPLAAALAWQRVRAGLHSPAQVAVGSAIGTVAGAAWSTRAQPALEAALGGAAGGGAAAAPATLALLGLFCAGVVGKVGVEGGPRGLLGWWAGRRRAPAE